jgi:hypothetical protein
LNHALRATLLADAFPELEGVTAVAYHNLLQYHSHCGEAIQSTTAQLRWFRCPTTLDYCRCDKTAVMFSDNMYHHVPVWFSRYLKGMCDVLSIIPGSNVRETGTFYAALGQNMCHRCCQFDFIGFVTSQLPAQLKVEIDKVCGTHHAFAAESESVLIDRVTVLILLVRYNITSHIFEFCTISFSECPF